MASRELHIPPSKIYISETSTNTVPNTCPSAASFGTDANGMAVKVKSNSCLFVSVVTSRAGKRYWAPDRTLMHPASLKLYLQNNVDSPIKTLITKESENEIFLKFPGSEVFLIVLYSLPPLPSATLHFLPHSVDID